MKKILIMLCLMVLGGVAIAQNVIGRPIYYNDSTQYRPGHGMGYDNPPETFGTTTHHGFQHDPNSIFLEASMMSGSHDVAWGLNLAYVPARWGLYGSALWGLNYDWIKAGGIIRLSNLQSPIDWQFYGGFVFGPGVGGEFGMRLAFDNIFGNHEFSWWSASLGVSFIGGATFMTCGVSIALSGFSFLGFIW